MSEFVEAAVKEAAPLETVIVDNNELARLFLAGQDGSSGSFHSAGRNLYEGSKVVARLCPDGSVLLPQKNISNFELNDALIGQLFALGRSYKRVDSFNNLSSPTLRLNDLQTGNIESLRSIASLFGLEVSPEDVMNYQRAKRFETSITEFFSKLEADELARVAEAEEKARKERVAAAAIAWDTGEGPVVNSNVKGAGGGQRLRVAKTPKRSGGRTYDRVETSTGNTTTVAQAQRAFAIATRFWHGGEALTSWGHSSYISGSRRVEVFNDRLKFGCQTVQRKEAERFADVMGWARATKANG